MQKIKSGRPRKPESAVKVNRTYALTPATIATVERMARTTGMSNSSVVEQAIRAWSEHPIIVPEKEIEIHE